MSRTIAEIKRDRDAAFRVIDALLIEARRKLIAGNASMQDVIESLKSARNQVEDAALEDILASDELAEALAVLAEVAKNLGETADNLQIAAEVTAKFAEVLGKAKVVVAEAKNVLA